ncbi:hypothetical protein PoB_001883900 [Plakobranchus ocellatus]|uniref:Uncharacterized protein n=1 Tax=Plakobranchus ocellatus TaxID=259542 RepID=A0AAV3ZEN5_9GAST|nr:hypothetical protein PoB_001883900 [Plakobranchus ocellatus]
MHKTNSIRTYANSVKLACKRSEHGLSRVAAATLLLGLMAESPEGFSGSFPRDHQKLRAWLSTGATKSKRQGVPGENSHGFVPITMKMRILYPHSRGILPLPTPRGFYRVPSSRFKPRSPFKFHLPPQVQKT